MTDDSDQHTHDPDGPTNVEPQSNTPSPSVSNSWDAVKLAGKASYLNPLPVLQEAIRQIPAVRWALGVVGLAAAVSLVLGFLGSIPLAVFGPLVLIGLMILLVVFAALSDAVEYLRTPGIILTYIVIVLVSLSLVLLFSSAFFDIPLRLRGLFEQGHRISLDGVSLRGTVDSSGNLSVKLLRMPEDPRSITVVFRRKGDPKPLQDATNLLFGEEEYDLQIPALHFGQSRPPSIECEISVIEHGRLKEKVVRDVRIDLSP